MVKWDVVQRPKKQGGLGVGDPMIKMQPSFLSGGGDMLVKKVLYGGEWFIPYMRRIKSYYPQRRLLAYQDHGGTSNK